MRTSEPEEDHLPADPVDPERSYPSLVAARQAYDPSPFGLANPSMVEGGRYDLPHVGPWTVWAHDLRATVMVVGQDWGDVGYFVRHEGFDGPGNPTNIALRELLGSIGFRLPDLPTTRADAERLAVAPDRSGVWLTNALLWLKTGGLSAPVEKAWFGDPAVPFLKAQLEIVQPRVIVALGQRAYGCLRHALGLPPHKGPFRLAVEDADGASVELGAHESRLFAVYHCGARIRNTVRTIPQQHADWRRVGVAIEQLGGRRG
jgi:hypothetical protein